MTESQTVVNFKNVGKHLRILNMQTLANLNRCTCITGQVADKRCSANAATRCHHFSQQLQMSSNVSFGGCGSVCAHAAIKSFLPPSTRDVSPVISFARPSSDLFLSGKGSTAREDGLGMRLSLPSNRNCSPNLSR